MNKKAIFKLLLCAIASLILSCLFQYTKNKVIDYYVIINIEISLFSVSLAIAALMITILEKYKKKVTGRQSWVKNSTDILKEICDNTVALLFLIILLALASILEPVIILIPKYDVMTTILLFSFIVSLITMLDTTLSIHKLVIGLKDLFAPNNKKALTLSKKEIFLIEAYRFLDDEHKKSFDELVKAITTNQQLDTRKQQDHK